MAHIAVLMAIPTERLPLYPREYKETVAEYADRFIGNEIHNIDSWEIGGRYSEKILKLKPEFNCIDSDFTDHALKCHIDKLNSNFPVYGFMIDGVFTKRDEGDLYGFEPSDKNWKHIFNFIYDSIPDDYYLFILDCHI